MSVSSSPAAQIANFDDLLRAARGQPEPQRLLFVFAGAELPPDSTEEQRRHFAAGSGGALVPLMCVDRVPDELKDFAALVEESHAMGPPWAIVFVAGLAGGGGRPPSSADAEVPLQRMVDAIKSGAHRAFIPFDRNGEAVRLV
jgi:hypothetical protein